MTSTEFIQNKISPDIYTGKYLKICDFMLLWTLFEKHILSATSSDSTIAAKILSVSNTLTVSYSDAFNKLKSWYFSDGKSDSVFSLFAGHWNPNHKRLVKGTIELESKATGTDKLATTIILIYKYRCNFFHGVKELSQVIPDQEAKLDCFNEFLIRCLSTKI